MYQENETQKLTAQFKRQEEENFALFNYVNELSHEVETLNDVTQELTDEIGKFKLSSITFNMQFNSIFISDIH